VAMPVSALARWWRRAEERRRIRSWRREGSPVPPPRHYKRSLLREAGRRFGIRTLVETGTWHGGTVEALRRDFDRIVSVELDVALHQAARERFANDANVTLLQGDSGAVLPRVLAELREPAVFWLDAHYSAGDTARGELETPVQDEVFALLDHPVRSHVVLIDDARLFVGKDDYPTLEEVRSWVAERRPDLRFEVRDDVIRIHPPTAELP
jgi:hypothetical protein